MHSSYSSKSSYRQNSQRGKELFKCDTLLNLTLNRYVIFGRFCHIQNRKLKNRIYYTVVTLFHRQYKFRQTNTVIQKKHCIYFASQFLFLLVFQFQFFSFQFLVLVFQFQFFSFQFLVLVFSLVFLLLTKGNQSKALQPCLHLRP